MFTLLLVAINVATLALGLINIGEKSNKPKSDNDDDDDDDDRTNILCA